ncbi:MAG: class I SAM-dependent methyltransferase [Acidimicrobiia bacterium]
MQRPEHVAENARYWDAMADDWVASGERSWRAEEPTWGSWHAPEADVGMLPADMTGMRAIELGCGTGYVSAWMARRGAEVVAVDVSVRQLETARRLQAEHGLDGIRFVEASAESVPEPDASFDLAISEYGAAIWCDPFVWIPEAARLLRPGGALRFLGNHPLAMACVPLDGSPVEPHLHRDWFGMHRFDWREVEIDPGGVEFNLAISEWFRLFDESGFDVEGYVELGARDPSEDRFAVPGAWAARWPAEQVWKLRRR